jgi:hypothetical protein
MFCDRVSHNAITPLIVAFSPGHSDEITRFKPWLTIVTGNHLNRVEKKYIPKVA